ncbi:MAG TPA: hypothetical protein VK760_13570 [Candidatus Acidoferrales bacterium]|jgi:hypothetical protein|nr:hypothetical protein [Candidatus Acidoferrales bacterium]
MKPFVAIAFAAAIAIGGCSSATLSTAPPAPTSSPSTLSIETQRIEAQAGIAVAQGIQVASLFTAVLEQLPLGGGTLPNGKCKNGVESTIQVLNPEQLQVTIDAFYDPACKTRFIHASVKTTYFPSGTLEIDGTSTAYNTRGRALTFATFTSNGMVASTGVQLTTNGTVSKSRSGPAQLSFGLTCTWSSQNDCGFGGVIAASPDRSLGVSATLDGFTGSGAASGTASVTAYAGKLKLKQGSGNAWIVSGAKPVASPTGTFEENVDAKSLTTTGKLNLTDAAANARVTLDFATRTGISNGKVQSVAPASPYSSFGTDATGTGAIAYSSGPGDRIVFFVIVPTP